MLWRLFSGGRKDDRILVDLPAMSSTELAVFFRPGPDGTPGVDTLLNLVNEWLGRHASSPFREQLKKWIAHGTLGIIVAPKSQLAPISPDMFPGEGMIAGQRDRLTASTHAVLIRGQDFGLAPHPGIWAAVAAARALAEALDGEAVDTMARCLVPPGDLAEDIPESGQVVIPRHLAFDLQALPAGGSALVSGGLAKFGLPDVELPGVPADLIREASEILGLVAAVLADWAHPLREASMGQPVRGKLAPVWLLSKAMIDAVHGVNPPDTEVAPGGKATIRFTSKRPTRLGTMPRLSVQYEEAPVDGPEVSVRRMVEALFLSDTQGGQSEDPAVSASVPEEPRRKATLASTVAAIGAVLYGGLWFGNRRRQQPAEADAHNNRGNAPGDQGKPADAEAAYRAALRLKPDDAEAHYNLGAALHAQGKLEEAVAELRTTIRLKPDSAGAHGSLGVVLGEQGKLEEAVAEHRTSIQLKPDDALAHYNLGIILGPQGKLEEAVAEFRTAIRLNPDFALAHGNLGVALVAQGKLEEAVASFLTAVRLNPDDAEAHYGLGTTLKARGKPEEAVAEFRTAIRLKPDFAEAHYSLGIALGELGKPEEAVAEFRTAIRLKPDDANARANLGTALGHQGKLEEAVAEFRTAIRLKPGLAGAYRNLGNALARQGKLEEAVAEFLTAIRLKPDDADAHYILAGALAVQGKPDEAVAEFRTAIRFKPDFAEAHYCLGTVLGRQGKLEEAVAELRKARDNAQRGSPLWQLIECALNATDH